MSAFCISNMFICLSASTADKYDFIKRWRVHNPSITALPIAVLALLVVIKLLLHIFPTALPTG